MKNTFQQEIFYVIKSKILILSVIAALVFIGFSVVQGISTQKSAVTLLKMGQKSDSNFQRDITKNYHITIDANGDESISNSARYDLEEVIKADYQLTLFGFPQYVFKAYGLTLFYLMTGLLGIFLASYDYKYKTFKRRLESGTWKSIIASKFLSLTTLTLFIFMLTTVVAMLVGGVLSIILKINPDYPNLVVAPSFMDVVHLAGIVWMITLFPSLACLAVTLAFKKSNVIIICFLVYHIMIPNLGKFDYTNSVLNIFSHFGQNLNIDMLPYIPISYPLSFILMIGYCLAIILISLKVFYSYRRYRLD
ncbi:MAG: hypothetical protein LBI43_02580 [Streptococcaceae bacterium]|jgi:hypothetical protein|nr:hypothetical protein [Streptococcaceae bacterium]